MSKIVAAILLGVIFLIGFGTTLGFRVWQARQAQPVTLPAVSPTPSTAFSPQPRTYQLEPPAQSLTGTISATLGEAQKTVRTLDELISVELGQEVLEDEKVTTGEDARVTIAFPPGLTIQALSDTILGFPSTNPARFLVKQDRGTATYQTDNVTNTISIRSMHALFSLTNGQAQLTTNPTTARIMFTIEEGSGSAGYINADNQTQIIPLEANQTLIYDDDTATVEIE